MANVKAHIWYDANGQIVAIGRPTGKHQLRPVGGANWSVLETEVNENTIKNLPRTHQVDVDKKALVEHKRPTKS